MNGLPMEEVPLIPKISALIVSYNSAPALRRCLTALEASVGRERMEILVVDNGSLDESPRLDADFPRVTMLRLPRNFGATKATNIGVRTAKGEYIFLLDPEVEVEPGAVLALSELLDNDTTAAAACPLLVTPEGSPAAYLGSLPTPETLLSAWKNGREREVPRLGESNSLTVEYPGREALLVRKSFAQGTNYLDERYGQYWSDAELCWRIARAQKKILLLTAVRGVLHPKDWEPETTGARALLSSDCGSGAAAFAGKHFGGFAGFRLRLAMIFSSLFSLLSFQDAGFQWGRLMGLLSGSRVDGSQSSL